jgi:membrane protease YdiL (CAAX protease family)
VTDFPRYAFAVRIRRAGSKVAFIAVIAVLWILVTVPLAKLPVPYNSIFGIVPVLALYLGPARAFRGKDEALEPPRAWWRMTSHPTAGLVVGVWLTLNAVPAVFLVISGTIKPPSDFYVTVSTYALLAALYFNSSIRLLRHPPQRVAGLEPLREAQPSDS